MSHAFIKPDHIDAENAENTHLFNVEKRSDKKYIVRSTAYCGNVKRKRECRFSFKETDNEARTHAADLENGSDSVCGGCVAHLYSDDD